MNDEEKQKVGKRFFDFVENIPFTPFGPSAEEAERRRELRRSGKVLGKYGQVTQAIGDAKNQVLGTVFSPVAKGIEAVSDATNVDERAIPAAVEIILTAAGFTKVPKSTLVKANNLGRRLGGKLPTVDGSTLDDVVDVVNPYKITSQTQRDILSQVNNKITSKTPITITSTGNVPVVVASAKKSRTAPFKKQDRTTLANQRVDKGYRDFKLLNDAQKAEAKSIISDLDQFIDAGLQGNVEGWLASRPTTRYSGNRTIPYTRKDGTRGRMYFNYSSSDGTIKATDIDKLAETTLRRKQWNINTDEPRAKQADKIYKDAKEANKKVKESLKILETTDPELFREIIGGDQIVYVEHIHAQKSPYWNKPRPFKPRDPENIIIISDDIFPKMKTAIEKIIYSDPKYKGKIYLDYDRATRDLILRDAQTDEIIGSAIPGITNTRDAKEAFLRALAGKDPLKLAEINPDLRKYIDYQDKISQSIAERLPDVNSSGAVPIAQDRFEELKRELETLETQLEASETGKGKVLSAIATRNLKAKIKRKKQEIEQLKLFDTSGPGTGLRTKVKQKPKKKKPAKVKKTKIDAEQKDLLNKLKGENPLL